MPKLSPSTPLPRMPKWLGKFKSIPRDVSLTILGGFAGWAISHFYYLRALEDMRIDAGERARVENLILRGIEDVGNIKYSRDSSGKVLGVAIELRGHANAQSTASGKFGSNEKTHIK